MKQYTNESQTDYLIDKGFDKPKNTQYVQRAKARNLHSPFIEFGEPEFEGSYSIGELIEMLDSVNETVHCRFGGVKANLVSTNSGYEKIGGELIDLLFDLCVKLKAEGVI